MVNWVEKLKMKKKHKTKIKLHLNKANVSFLFPIGLRAYKGNKIIWDEYSTEHQQSS